MTALFIKLQNSIPDTDDRGAAMAEYGLLLALVVLGAMAIMATFGDTLVSVFGFANETLEGANINGGSGSGTN